MNIDADRMYARVTAEADNKGEKKTTKKKKLEFSWLSLSFTTRRK